MSLDLAKLAMLVGQLKEACQREVEAVESLPLSQSSDIDIAWHLSSIEHALYSSVEQVVALASEIIGFPEDVQPWRPRGNMSGREELVDAWVLSMQERIDVLSRLYEEARNKALESDVGEDDISIDDLL